MLVFSCSMQTLFMRSHVTKLSAPVSPLMPCNKPEKPYYFSVCAVFKNEAVNLYEWISHYLLEGAEHIFLVDNGSEDNFVTIVQPFIDRGVMFNWSV